MLVLELQRRGKEGVWTQIVLKVVDGGGGGGGLGQKRLLVTAVVEGLAGLALMIDNRHSHVM